MADIVSDIALIQDEDQLRRMWSQTEDFGKKKEIRVRLYKLRESRLKNFYTSDSDNSSSTVISKTTSSSNASSNMIQETNRKHTVSKTHADSLSDQGYMSLKSKEIRDSESPTRDIHGNIIRKENNNFSKQNFEVTLKDNNTVVLPNSQDWVTNQSANYTTKTEGNSTIESAERSSEAVLAKNNESVNMKAYEAQEFASTDNSKDGNIDKSTSLRENAELIQNSSYKDDNTSFEAVSKQKKDTSVSSAVKQVGNVTTYSTSTRTVSSKSSASKTISSSSKIVSSNNLAIDSGDDFNRTNLSIKQNEDDFDSRSNYSTSKRNESEIRSSTNRLVDRSSPETQFSNTNETDTNTINKSSLKSDVNKIIDSVDNDEYSNTRSSKFSEQRADSSSSIRSSKITKSTTESSTNVHSSTNSQKKIESSDYDQGNDQSVRNLSDEGKTSYVDQSERFGVNETQNYSNSNQYNKNNEFINTERIVESANIDVAENDSERKSSISKQEATIRRDSSTRKDSSASTRKDSSASTRRDSSSRKYSTRRDSYAVIPTPDTVDADIPVSIARKNSQSTTISSVENKNMDQKILTELNNLDSYLSTHPTSTPVSPRSAATDFDYQDARRTPVKHPSSLDLPKECTDGHYLTTYNESYKNRISTNIDVSPTHNAFVSSLRADTPERSPTSPNRTLSTDRKSPRSSPEKNNQRSVSENRYRKSPEKTPTRESPKRFAKAQEPSLPRGSPDRYHSKKNASPEKTPTRDFYAKKSPERTPTREIPQNSRRSPTKSPLDNQTGKQSNRTTPQHSPERVYNKIPQDTDATRRTQDRKMSSSSYTVETKKKVDTNKSRRKFSSAQSKDAAKKRVSTPKVSPDTSPTRDYSSSDSSNDSQGTYNKDVKNTTDVTRAKDTDTLYTTDVKTTTNVVRSDSHDTYNINRSDSHDTYNINRSDSHDTYDKTTGYHRSDSSDTFNKYRRGSTDTFNKDNVSTRTDSRGSYTLDYDKTTEYERSDSQDSFNVSKLRKDSTDITKQDLKQRKLFHESDSEHSTRTDDFIKTERSVNIQQTQNKSPSVSPVRQKSPEYSSEGSVTKEVKQANALTEKNLKLIEHAENVHIYNKSADHTSPSITPCTSPDSYQTLPRRPSILKKKTADVTSHETNIQTSVIDDQKSTQKSRPTSPDKTSVKNQNIERKTSILKTSKTENVDTTREQKTTDHKSSILKSPTKQKSPERSIKKDSEILKEDFEVTITEKRQSPVREQKSPSPERAKKSPSPAKSPRQSPTRSVISVESRLTSPTQASMLREQKTTEYFEHTIKDRSSPTKSPSRDKSSPTDFGQSPQRSPVRERNSPEKKSPVREKKSPEKTPVKQVQNRPTRKSNIPRAESLKGVNKRTPSSTPSGVRQATPKTTPTKVTPTKAPTPTRQPSKPSVLKQAQTKTPVTTRTSSTNIVSTIKKANAGTLTKTNSYTSRRATEPVKQHKPVAKLPTKIASQPIKQAPKQPVKKLPVKSPKTSKELKISSTKKQTKTKVNVEENIRASNKALQNILSQDQQDHDSEIDDELPPEEFIVEDDEFYATETLEVTTKQSTTNRDKARRRLFDDQDQSSSDNEDNENVTVTKSEKIDQTRSSKQNDDLLSVIVQLPNSSRESTPGVKQTEVQQVPYSQDLNKPVRYADYYSEPETDNEKTSVRNEQVTDLDEEIDINVSVADRVNKFLKSTQEDIETQSKSETIIEKKTVSQAKNIFENIAKTQSSPTYNNRGPNVTKTYSTPSSVRQTINDRENKQVTEDFIFTEKETIDISEREDDQSKKSPKDIYLEKTQRSSTPIQKSSPKSQPQKKVFDDTYYIEKNRTKIVEDEDFTDKNKTTIDSCDEYIEIKEEITPKKSPKDIYLEKAQKSSSKTDIIETRKKSIDVDKVEKKPEEKPNVRGPSTTTANSLKSKKNFFEEKIQTETVNSKTTLNKTTEKFDEDKKISTKNKSPVRQSPERSPQKKYSTRKESPTRKSPEKQTPLRKSPEKVAKRKYEGRKDSLVEIRTSNLIAERRSKFSPAKEKSECVRRTVKTDDSKENIKPTKKLDQRSSDRKSQDRTSTILSETVQVKETRRQSKDRKPSIEKTTLRKPSVDKQRKPSVERPTQRKPSSDSKFEERKASFETRTTERKVSSEQKFTETRISSDRTVTESRKTSSSEVRSSPEKRPRVASPENRVSKKSASPDYEPKPGRKDSSNKFGVTLKKTSTSTTTTAVTSKNNAAVLKPSTKNNQDSIFDIESIFDLELLEKMLEKAVGYDQRRNLRAQIREVRRLQEEKSTRKLSSVSPSRNTNQKKSLIEEQKHKDILTSTTNKHATNAFKSNDKITTTPKPAFPTQKLNQDVRSSTITSNRTSSQPLVDQATVEKKNAYQRTETSESVKRKSSSTETTQSTYTISQVRTHEEATTDSITSSYGVGPTDENGRPLFGLKALRRTNTNKVLGDEKIDSSVQIDEDELDIRDSAGRPLFGIAALKPSEEEEEEDMPEQTATQFQNLLQKHEKTSHAENVTSSSHSTVVSSKTTMKTDSSGKMSVTRDLMQGEISVKDNEDPKGKLVKAEYKYNKANSDDKGKSESKVTTAILNSTNIRDSKISENYKLTDHNKTNNKFIENERKHRAATESIENRKNIDTTRKHFTKTDSNSSFTSKQNQENDSRTNSYRKTTESFASKQNNAGVDNERKHLNNLSSKIIESEKRSNSFKKTDSNASFSSKYQVEEFDDEDEEEAVRRKPVVRGDSIRALQHKFQQATVSSSMKQSSSPTFNESKSVTTTSSKSVKNVNAGGPASSTVTNNKSSVVTTTRTETVSSVISKRSSYLDTEDEELEDGGSDTFRSSVIEDDGFGNSSAALVNRIEKQRVASSTGSAEVRGKINFSDLDQIADESQLRILLEACSDYEGRRKIRARLREVMAENHGVADSNNVVATTNGNVTKTEVHTRVLSQTGSTHRLTKANSVQVPSVAPASPFAKFKQLERQNSAPNARSASPLFKIADPKLARSASSIKDTLLSWVKAQTSEYKNIKIENFSTSWNDGLAFCALIHHFYPNAFDYDQLTPDKRRYNFELAFRVAEEQADLMPLLDVEDMVVMKRPDWKCVFTYVQTFYRRFHSSPQAVKIYQ